MAIGYQESNDLSRANANLWICNLDTGVWVKVTKDTVTDIVVNSLSSEKYYNESGKLFFTYGGNGIVIDYGQFLTQI